MNLLKICPWQTVLITTGVVELLLSISYLVVSISAYDKCYVVPCYEGPGLEELWKINKGVGLSGVFSAVFVIIFAAFSLWLIPRTSLQDAPLMFGFFVGMSFILSLVLIEQMCIWGAEWNLIDNLDKLSDFSSVFSQSGRHMKMRDGLLEIVQRMVYMLAGLLLVQVSIVIVLVLRHREILADLLWLRGGSYTRVVSMADDVTGVMV